MTLIASILVAATCSLAATATAAPVGQPRLELVDRAPVVVRGSGFGTGERVLVTLYVEPAMTRRRATTSAGGAFQIRFEGVRLTPCTGAALVAAGTRGTVTRLKVALRECPGAALEPSR